MTKKWLFFGTQCRHIFPTFSPGGATLFDLVSDDDIRSLPLIGGLQCGTKGGGEACSVQLPCICKVTRPILSMEHTVTAVEISDKPAKYFRAAKPVKVVKTVHRSLDVQLHKATLHVSNTVQYYSVTNDA